MTRCVLAAALALSWGCAHAQPSVPPPAEWQALSGQAEIRRTAFGIPHIRATNLRAAGFALAWVQLEDHGDRIIAALVEARGETALRPGARKSALDWDFLARRRHARAVETFPRLPADVRDVYDGFAAGVNRYMELHPEEVTGVVAPFTGADVLARDVEEPAWSAARRFSSRAPDGAPIVASWRSGSDWTEEGPGAPDPETRLPGWEAGSNTWALAPSRTTSGRAILMRNPHLSWTAGYYEAHVAVPGVMDFYGDFRLGGPFGMIGGFNARLGWSSTNNAPELSDIYALERDPARPDHYVFGGRSMLIERIPVILHHRTGDGVETETRDRLETVLGPVFHQDDARFYVVRTGGEGAYRVGEQFLRMMTATTLEEWQDAMRIQARNASNFTYADADGNIFYVWNAAHPVRPHRHGGDTLAVMASGWGDVWKDVIAFDDLPQLLNPPGGYLRNENDPFHHTNLNVVLDPARFPPEFPEPRVRLRSQHSMALIQGDRRFSLEEVWEAKHSMGMLLADRVKDDLLAAVAETVPTGEVAAAAELLRGWDNTASADARGAVLFVEWWARYLAGAGRASGSSASAGFPAHAERLFREPWSLEDPMATPRGLAEPQRAATAFVDAVRSTSERWGRWDVAWGEVHRARLGSLDLPVGGCDGLLGCFRILWFSEDADGKRRVRGGDGWVFAVEFGDTPRAYTVLAYGQSNRPGHPHSEDQLAMFVDGGRKAIAFTESDIDASLLRRYRPGVERRYGEDGGGYDLTSDLRRAPE
jgi:acyl-homoserine-lactone acylase